MSNDNEAAIAIYLDKVRNEMVAALDKHPDVGAAAMIAEYERDIAGSDADISWSGHAAYLAQKHEDAKNPAPPPTREEKDRAFAFATKSMWGAIGQLVKDFAPERYVTAVTDTDKVQS